MKNIFYQSLQIYSPLFSTLLFTWSPLAIGLVNGDLWGVIWGRKGSYFRKVIPLVLSREFASSWLCSLDLSLQRMGST